MEDSIPFNGLSALSMYSSSNDPSHFFSSIFPSASLQNIGCTVVVHQSNQPIVLQNFFHMPISTNLLAERGGAYSLYLDTLIIAMQSRIFNSLAGSVEPVINALLHNQPLNGLISGTNTVTIATCRIPNFSNITQDSSLGYIQLPGSLDQLLLYIPNSSHFMECGRELLSIGSILQENTQVKTFLNAWQSSGMQLDFHFILLFLLRPVCLATAIEFNGFLSPSPLPISSPSPPFQFSNPWVPATLLGAASTRNSIIQTSGHLGMIAASNFSQVLTDNEVHDSQYNKKNKGIVAQVKNWRAMKNVLTKLSVAFMVSDEDRSAILEKFGWSAMTFKNKSLWYEWASEAAQRTWREHTLTRSQHRQEHRQWCGIVYLFRPHGAIDRDYIPKATSVDLEERWAAEVTQAKIDSMRTTISAHLA